MARRSLSIPEEVKAAIRTHLAEKYPIALDGYWSANEDEDSLTGDLGATIRIKNQKVFVEKSQIERSGEWTWSIDYRKFRGRGPNATENILGADGLFELSLGIGNRVEKKTLLFQSKKDWTFDNNLVEQAIKLSTWREAAFIINFSENSFEAIDLDSILVSRGHRTENIRSKSLDKFIGEDFLNCIVGDFDLSYDAVSRKLIWRNMDDEIVATKFSIPQRITIKIDAPNHTKYKKIIKNEEIYNHRMYASEEDILSLEENYSEKDIKKARDKNAKIYHLDTNNNNNPFLNSILNRRMQEVNNSYEKIKNKFTR
jgi:hypothetical protein